MNTNCVRKKAYPHHHADIVPFSLSEGIETLKAGST